MKPNVKRPALLLMFFGMLVLMLCPVTASAATKKYVNMNPAITNKGKTYTWKGTYNWGNYDTYAYHKVVIPGFGRIQVSGLTNTGGSINVTLCDSRGNNIQQTANTYVNANSRYASSQYVTYGVKRGTYYIRVNKAKYYSIAMVYNYMKDIAGKAKSVARALPYGTNYTGVMANGDGFPEDWYKFYLSSSRHIAVVCTFIGQGSFSAYLYGPSFPRGERIYLGCNDSGKVTSYTTYRAIKGGLKPGYYYIKIMRSGANQYKKSSCGYWVKWRYR